MSTILNTTTAIIMLGLAATGTALARGALNHSQPHPGPAARNCTAAATNAAVQQSGSTNQYTADQQPREPTLPASLLLKPAGCVGDQIRANEKGPVFTPARVGPEIATRNHLRYPTIRRPLCLLLHR
jgi:hypothetical protein